MLTKSENISKRSMFTFLIIGFSVNFFAILNDQFSFVAESKYLLILIVLAVLAPLTFAFSLHIGKKKNEKTILHGHSMILGALIGIIAASVMIHFVA